MQSKLLGKLNPHEFDPDLYVAEPIEIAYLDQAKISVGIACADDAPTLKAADEALSNFLKLSPENRISDSKILIKYYETCLRHGIAKALDLRVESDIWNFVYPSEIVVDSLKDEGFFLSISCGCEWAPEHGLELIFKNGEELIRAGEHE